MLAGCSSTLLSPRHRLRSEASGQFQVCHLPSMSTQRLDLPCSFGRKDAPRSSQSIRPVGITVENPIEAKTTNCSLRQNIKLPPSAKTEGRRESKDKFWEKSKKKRYAEEVSYDEEIGMNRVKKKRCSGRFHDSEEGGGNLSIGHLGGGNFWFHPGFDVPRSIPPAGPSPPQVPFSITCSGEEERVCFVPSDVMSPPLPPLSSSPWLEPIGDKITRLGDKNAETSQGRAQEGSRSSSTSSESGRLVLRLIENPGEHETGNGSRPLNPSDSVENVAGHNGENNHREHFDIELVNLLVACVEAIRLKNIANISHIMARLGELASPRGSTICRLAAYFTEALALRISRLWPHIFHITIPRELDQMDDTSGTALRILNEVSPFPKFIHFTSNEILLRAFDGKDRVHIIDFDIKQGLQWPSLFQSLASRTNPPSHVRITGVGESKQELIETGNRLAGFAAVLNLPFEFHHVVDKLEDVRLWMLHVKEDETVAVNCVFQMHKLLYDSTGRTLRDFLGLIRSTNPAVVVMSEQEAEHNDTMLERRFSNSLKYYSAIFDSLDSISLPADSPLRIKMEEMFAREIRNIIACEGRDRIERHETFWKWRQLMEQGGFQCSGFSDRELLQGQMLLKMYSCENYRVEKQGQDGNALTLGWLDQPLYTVSAWAPVDIAGSSSSYSQPT
ncbi:scarecrow 28 [Olea europaea subsp. europaea]|uniref:Scarecrow 28 n=1 Tax=Olea europaea subsp. europaea TaxID=158383 RepID=A0A8S0RC63_OLEEU|nr:scarecrow 28 [Olea europaea subsp. europaea]